MQMYSLMTTSTPMYMGWRSVPPSPASPSSLLVSRADVICGELHAHLVTMASIACTGAM